MAVKNFISIKIIALLLVTPWCLSAQPNNKSIESFPIPGNQPVQFDGIIDEDFWQEISPISDFRMKEPIINGEPTEQTEVRIAYDKTHLYIAVVLHDSEPAGIKAFQKRRDNALSTDDSFTWFLDTYLDKRNAYLFSINPLGLRNDALLTAGQGSSINTNWDGIWDVRTHIGDFGWSAEIKIPFRTLNFDKEKDSWGINFQRIIRRKNEVVIWSGYQQQQNIQRPQDGGVLQGMRGMSQGIGLEAKPYAILRNEKIGDQDDVNEASGGLDINYNVTTNLKASVTLNTDFAETEVDDRRINLTRFPLQFPEKRDFFLEGSGIYSYAPSSSIYPYFSRSIGLRDGKPIPIKYGARILGRIGNTDMAVLQVRTGARDSLQAEHFTVARFKQNIGKESTIGVVYTRRATDDGALLTEPLQDRHTFGTDLAWNTSTFLGDKNLQFQAFLTMHNPETPLDTISNHWDRSTRGWRINFPNQPWFAHCSYREFGETYDPAVGFNRRNNFRRIEPAIGYAPIFQNNNVIRQVMWRVLYQNLWDMNFNLLTQNLRLILADVRFESGERIGITFTRNFERLRSDFDILRDASIIIPEDSYTNWSALITASTASFRRIVGQVSYQKGGFWSGNQEEWLLGATIRPAIGLNLSARYSLTKVKLTEGAFNTSLMQFEGGYDITTNISFASIVQYDDISNKLGMNHRFRWIVTPGSDIYLVYTKNWFYNNQLYQPIDRAAVFKVNYTHRF